MTKSSKPKRPKIKKKPSSKKTKTSKTADAPGAAISSLSLLNETLRFFYQHRRKLFGIMFVLWVLYLLFIRSGSTFELDTVSQLINDQLGDNQLVNKAVLTGILIGSGGSSDSGTGSLGVFLLATFGSLAFIWSIRHLVAEKKFKIRDAYYRGMYPLVPFVIVIFIISLQLIPFVLGGFLYATAEINGLASSLLERSAFVILWVVLSVVSVFWLTNSLMSVYAVTLPDIYPLQALRSTKQIVRGRRLSVFMKIINLTLFLLAVSGIILLAIIMTLPAIAIYAYDVLLVLSLMFTHVYLFKLYKSLI